MSSIGISQAPTNSSVEPINGTSTYREARVRQALIQLLLVINEDKDGSFFICKEAKELIVQANLALED